MARLADSPSCRKGLQGFSGFTRTISNPFEIKPCQVVNHLPNTQAIHLNYISKCFWAIEQFLRFEGSSRLFPSYCTLRFPCANPPSPFPSMPFTQSLYPHSDTPSHKNTHIHALSIHPAPQAWMTIERTVISWLSRLDNQQPYFTAKGTLAQTSVRHGALKVSVQSFMLMLLFLLRIFTFLHCS